jgi:hypothetical protein
MCCEVTREWVTAMDFSELGGADVTTGPRWLRQRFNWGCSTFPITGAKQSSGTRSTAARLRLSRTKFF